MNVLTNEQSRSYDYISRYTRFKIAYHASDGKYVYEVTSQIKNNVQCVIHKVTSTDDLDFLANKYYGRPDLYWVIADFNRIQDPFIKLSDKYTTLKIPSITEIEYER